MLNKTRIALAAALIFGSASAAMAGEGSPDLALPAGYDNTGLAPSRTTPTQWQGAQSDPLSAYAFEPQYNTRRGFTAEEKALFDRVTGSPDRN